MQGTRADEWGLTPLVWSVICLDVAEVKQSLRAGADPNARGAQGETALMYAAGRDPGIRICSLGPYLCPPRQLEPGEYERDQLLVIEELLDRGALVDATDGAGRTALWYAVVSRPDARVAEVLLRAGANPDRRGDGELVHWAALRQQAGILRVLLAHGADPNARQIGQTTALMEAADSMYGTTEHVRLLLAHGAEVEAQHRDGTAWVMARRRGNIEVLHLLEAAGAKRYSRWPPGETAGLDLRSLVSAGDGVAPSTAYRLDPDEWQLRRAIEFDRGGGRGRATALLLRSNQPKGTTGMGEPAFKVSLLVTSPTEVITHFEPYPEDRSFHMDDFLEAVDVTGDGVPEVLFHSGFQGVSDFVHVEHVLHVPEGEAGYWEVAPAQFVTTRRQSFRWIEHGGRMLALVADPLIPAGTVDPHFCHGCPHFYEYLVFAWRADRGAFALLQVIQGQRDFEDGEDPLSLDLHFILSRIPEPPRQP